MRKMILGGSACLLLVAGGCMSAYNQRQVAIQQDREACSRYGADAKSLVYLDCMALQERRRETATAGQNLIVARDTEVVAGR